MEPRRDEDALREPKVREVTLLCQPLVTQDSGRLDVRPQVRIAVVNCYTALGIPVAEAVG